MAKTKAQKKTEAKKNAEALKAKKKAESIVNAYGPADQFQIISHDLKGSQQRWINKENVIQAIEDIQLSPKVNNLANVYNKQKQSAQKEGNHIIYYLSDFQKSITDLPVEADTTLELNLLPFQSVKESNITIDSAWFESVVPSINQNNKLFVRLKNHSDEKRDDVRLSINHNGQNRPEGTINIGANSTKTDTINLLLTEAGWQKLEIKIDDYPIQFDDSYFISFNIKEKINILSIYNNQPDRYLTALFKGLNQFELDKVKESSIQYDKLKDYDLIILSELKNISTGLSGGLKTYVENGGNVLVFPSELSNLESYNNFLAQLNANGFDKWTKEERNVYKINTAEFTFSNVYTSTGTNLKLPTTKGNFTVRIRLFCWGIRWCYFKTVVPFR